MSLLGQPQPGSPSNPFGQNLTPTPFVQSREFRRMLVMGLFGLLFVGVIVGQLLGPSKSDPQLDPRRHDLPENRPVVPPVQPSPTEFEGFQDVQDHTPIEYNTPFFKALEIVAKLSPEETSKRVDKDLIFPMLMKFPAECRTRFVRIEGLLIKMYPFPDRMPTNPAGVEDVYEAYLADLASDEAYCVRFLERPTQVLTEETDRVVVEGLFYKIFTYKNIKNQDRSIPLLIARRLQYQPSPNVDTRSQFTWVVLGVTGTMLGIILGMGWWNARRDRVFLDRIKPARDRANKARNDAAKERLEAARAAKAASAAAPPVAPTPTAPAPTTPPGVESPAPVASATPPPPPDAPAPPPVDLPPAG